MLLAEPPRSSADLNFGLLGIPVRVHWSFWLVSVLMCFNATGGDAVLIVSWVAASFLSIVVHEMGHALIIRKQGWRPWVTLYAMGGLASYHPTRHNPWTQIQISFAGPAAGFIFAALIYMVLLLSGHPVEFPRDSSLFFSIEITGVDTRVPKWDFIHNLLFINIWWGLLNLLPIFPLDGGNISREFLNMHSSDGLRISLQLSMVTAIVVAILGYMKLHDLYIALFFGYMAFMSYQTLQAYSGRGGRDW